MIVTLYKQCRPVHRCECLGLPFDHRVMFRVSLGIGLGVWIHFELIKTNTVARQPVDGLGSVFVQTSSDDGSDRIGWNDQRFDGRQPGEISLFVMVDGLRRTVTTKNTVEVETLSFDESIVKDVPLERLPDVLKSLVAEIDGSASHVAVIQRPIFDVL